MSLSPAQPDTAASAADAAVPDTSSRPGDGRPVTPADLLPPALSVWSSTWRYVVVSLTALVVLVIASDELPLEDESPDVVLLVFGIIALDVVFGVTGICLLPLRRRRPLLVAVSTAALTAVSASALAASALAAVSVSTRGRRGEIAGVGLVWLASGLFYEQVLRLLVPVRAEEVGLLAIAAVLLVGYGVCVVTGVLVGGRRRLLASLHERAATAEREQALKAEMAREAERTRIAREMHDVLAHRISLVALHAGALDYRQDLTREQTAETAAIVRENAHLALTELRQVLGVLRSGGGSRGGAAEPPQPTLAELPALLADATEAGTEVRLDVSAVPEHDTAPLAALSETTSRTAFRIVQEGLTNARKHAPGVPVSLRLGGAPGGHLTIEVRNAVAAVTGDGPPGAGMGLVGLAERAGLCDGRLSHAVEQGAFVLRAELPWR